MRIADELARARTASVARRRRGRSGLSARARSLRVELREPSQVSVGTRGCPRRREEPGEGRRRRAEQESRGRTSLQEHPDRDGVREAREQERQRAHRRGAAGDAAPPRRRRGGTPTSSAYLGSTSPCTTYAITPAVAVMRSLRATSRRCRAGDPNAATSRRHRHDHDAAADTDSALKKRRRDAIRIRRTRLCYEGAATTTDALLDRLTAAPGEAAIFLRLRRRARADRRAARGRRYPAGGDARRYLRRLFAVTPSSPVVQRRAGDDVRERSDVDRRRDRRLRTASSSIARPIGWRQQIATSQARHRGLVGDRA